MGDKLYRDVHWSHRAELPVLGVTTKFLTNSQEVLKVVHETYGAWEALAGYQEVVSRSRAVVKLVLTDPPFDAAGPPSFSYRVPDHMRMLILSESGSGVADTTRLESVAYVTTGLVSQPAEFAEGLLEPLTLFLLGALDRQPLHAAAVVRDGVAILLEGPSGVGKSTLAHAARREGFTPLCDEAVYVQMEPALRVWSRRSRVHLRPEARAHFPELAGVTSTHLPGGKTRIVVPADAGSPRYADRAGICMLERGSPARLERLEPGRAAAAVASRLEPGFDLYASTIRERAARVAERGAWSLVLAGDPAEGAALLDEVATELARGG